MKKPTISIIGLGFVGLSLAVVNAKKGFQTIGIDIDLKKIHRLQQGNPDFYEPSIEKYLKESLKTKNIKFTNNINSILESDLTFLTVGTPPTNDGRINLKHIENVMKDIIGTLKRKKSHHLIVVKSTVIPTTTRKIIMPKFTRLSNVDIVVNPEFLREGSAINDLLKPHLIVIGETSKESGNRLEKYYKTFYRNMPEVIRTDPTTAEMIKYANNSFLATKVSFINSIANICQKIPDTDVNTVAYSIGKDPRIGELFLKAGPGFGGSCLPKDLSALIKLSDTMGYENHLLKAVQVVNETQPLRIIELMKDLKVLKNDNKVSILGLAFKKDTDDIRAAISVKLVNLLLDMKLKVRVHDPMAIRNFRAMFRDKIAYFDNVQECLRGTVCCILLTDWDEYERLNADIFKKYMKSPNIIDGRRILDPKKFSSLNFKAIGLGS